MNHNTPPDNVLKLLEMEYHDRVYSLICYVLLYTSIMCLIYKYINLLLLLFLRRIKEALQYLCRLSTTVLMYAEPYADLVPQTCSADWSSRLGSADYTGLAEPGSSILRHVLSHAN